MMWSYKRPPPKKKVPNCLQMPKAEDREGSEYDREGLCEAASLLPWL